MTERSRVLRIFISSPGDVVEERTLTKRVLERLAGEFSGRITLEPVFWEHEPLLATDSFQKQIVRPSETDILVSILWSRLGTRLPAQFTRADGSRYDSGTEYEFEDAVTAYKQKGKPDLLVYRKTADPVVSLKDKKALLEKLSQKEALDAFFSKWFHDEAEGTLIAAFHPFERSSDFEELLESHLKKLIERRLPEEAPGAEARTAPAQWREGSPFRGLHVFSFEHAPIFFGRTKAASDVLNALRVQASEGRAFVLVLGMSGGGKSSLVQAGVLPVLTQPGVIEGVGLWRHAIMRPGDSSVDVFDALAASILGREAVPELAGDNIDSAELAQLLRETPKAVLPLLKTGLSQAAAESVKVRDLAGRPSARLVLVVDQMEELFTLGRVTAADRARFVEALDILARSGWAWVVATMRSDFYPRCAELEKLVLLKEGAGQYDLLPPTPAEIGQMIRQPALAAGLHFEEDPATKERLDEVLRDAAAKNPGNLALLEFTLEELYKKRTEKGLLTHEAYMGLGGVEGALAQRGEEVYEGLEKGVQSALGPVFNGLVGIGQGEDETITRKYAPYEAITSTPETRKFVETFVEARLFVTDLDDKGNAVVSVAHEALLKHWPRLQDWVEKNKENLRARARVSTAASRWMEEGKTRDFLLAAGKPLAEAEELVKNPSLELSDQERTFIKASIAKKRRLWWMKRAVVAALAVLTVAAAGAAYLANKQRERAQIEAKTSTQVSDFLVNLFEVSDPSKARGNSITAREVLDRGVEKIKEELKDQPKIQATLMSDMGLVYEGLGLYEQATPLLENALSIRKKIYGDEHPEVGVSMSDLAALMIKKGDFDGAESLLRKAAETYRKSKGYDRDYADILANLAGVMLSKGDHEAADSLFLEELSIRRSLAGDNDADIARIMHNRGGVCMERGDFGGAEALFREALETRRRVLGNDHPDTVATMSTLTTSLSQLGKFEEAEMICREVLTIRRRLLGNEHPGVAITLHNLASTLLAEGEYEEAESLIRESLDIQRKVWKNKHPQTARSVNALAVLLTRQNRLEEAEPAARECLAISREVFGRDHPDVAVYQVNLANLLIKKKAYAEAEQLIEDALTTQKKILGDKSPAVADTLQILGGLHANKGDYDRAVSTLRGSLEIRRSTLPEGHYRTLSNMKDLGNALAKLRQFEEAEKLLRTSYASLESQDKKRMGDISSTLKSIVELYELWGKPEQAAEYRAKLEALSK